MLSCTVGGPMAVGPFTTPGQLSQGLNLHTINETNNNTLEKTPLIIKVSSVDLAGVSIHGAKGKRGPSGPIVTTSDEEESPDSPRGRDRKLSSSQDAEDCRTLSPPMLDHDYENVSSPGNSSTASGPTYVRPPGFTHHAHEIVTVSKPRIKKKKTTLVAMKDGVSQREPTPPKSKPKREPLPMRMRALPQSFWQQPNVPLNVSPATTYPLLPPLFCRVGEEEELSDIRPITPPAEDRGTDISKDKPLKTTSHRPVERKITINNTDLLFKLFEGLEKESKRTALMAHTSNSHTRRGRPRKVMPSGPSNNNKTLVTGEDPYLVDSISQKLFPKLRLEQGKTIGNSSAINACGSGASMLDVITLRDGDRCVTLPSLSVEQNYPQMLSELVAHI